MNILFRVDASHTLGMGHLMRCLALAQGLSANKHKIQFLVRRETRAYCLSRNDWVGEIVTIPNFDDVSQETFYLKSYLANLNIEAWILDGYQFDEPYREAFIQSASSLIVFDDNNDSGNLFADMVLNSAQNAASLGYEITAPKAQYCLGAEYRILRQEFLEKGIEQVKCFWRPRRQLTIVMGGSDPENLTIGLLAQLQAQRFNSPIAVATGAAYVFTSQFKTFVSGSCLQVAHYENCQSMAKVFVESRLVVSAAGGTQFELLACATPAFLLVVADNQVNATQAAAKQQWCNTYDMRDDNSIVRLVNDLVTLWADEEKLEGMHQQAKLYADVTGTMRVVKLIEQLQSNNTVNRKKS